MFNMAIDSKLQRCDLVSLKIDDLCVGGRLRRRNSTSTDNSGDRSTGDFDPFRSLPQLPGAPPDHFISSCYRNILLAFVADMIRARVFAIACGYQDADDLDFLRADPAFKLACGRLPDTGGDLCSQPTLSRLENAPGLKDVIRVSCALVDQWMDSYQKGAAFGHARHR